MADKSAVFVLDSSDMRKSSYYFFAIQDVKKTSNWFTTNRTGTIHVFYGFSTIPPDCVLNDWNNYSCIIKVSNSNQCFLGHVLDNGTVGAPDLKEVTTIHYRLRHTTPTKLSYAILATSGVVLILMAILFLMFAIRFLSLFVKKHPEHSTLIVHKNGSRSNVKTIAFNEKGLLYHCPTYGITTIIPEGAVQGPATLQFEASFLSSGFNYRGAYMPVSPFVWIHFDRELQKPAKLYIPHYVVIDTDEQKRNLHVLTRGHDADAVFEVNHEVDVEISDEVVCVSTAHFCSLCIHAEKVMPRIKYHVLYAIKVCGDERLVDICVLQSRHCLTLVRNYYKKRKFEVSSPRPIDWGTSANDVLKISVDLPSNTGWKYAWIDYKTKGIRQKDVDVYKFLECTAQEITRQHIADLEAYEEEGTYPPRFKMIFYIENQHCKKCSVDIKLHSSLESEVISIHLMLDSKESFSRSASLEPNPLDSTIHEATPFLAFMLKDRNQFFKFCTSLGLNHDDVHQIITSVGHDIKQCLEEALRRWKEQLPNGCFKDIAEALEHSRNPQKSVEDEEFVMVNFSSQPGKMDISLQSFPNSSGTMTTGNYQMYSILRSLPRSSKLESKPTFPDLDSHVATKLPTMWELFGTQLNISQPALDVIRENHPRNTLMHFHEMLKKWEKSHCSPFTWATVLAALCSPAVNEYKVAEDLREFLQEY